MLINQKGIAHYLVLLLVVVGIAVGLFLVQNPQVFSPKADQAPVKYISVHRLYNPQSNGWYWSEDKKEIGSLISQGYRDEGVLFYAFPAENHPEGSVPLYRLRRNADPFPQVFLTTSKPEIDLIVGQNMHAGFAGPADNIAEDRPAFTSNWSIEEPAFYVFPNANNQTNLPLTAVFRLMYNSSSDPNHPYNGIRYYSADQQEVDALVKTGQYVNEGIAFLGYKPNQ